MFTVDSHVETMCGAKVGLDLFVSGACNDSFYLIGGRAKGALGDGDSKLDRRAST